MRPSRKVFEAALAAFFDVTFLGAFVCDKALPAADFELFPVEDFFKVFDALLAAFFPVTLGFAILTPPHISEVYCAYRITFPITECKRLPRNYAKAKNVEKPH